MHDAARADVDDIAAGMSTDAGIRFYNAVQRTCEFLAEFPNVGTRRSAADPSLVNLCSYGVRGFRNYLFSSSLWPTASSSPASATPHAIMTRGLRARENKPAAPAGGGFSTL
jgi:hypothetical protein